MRSTVLPGVAKSLLRPLKETFRSVAVRSYSLSRLHTRISLAFSRFENPVLIYTMGKVGSSSLEYSLRSAAPELDVLHLHWLVTENLARDERVYREAARRHRGTAAARKFRPRYIWLGRHFSSRVKRDRPDGSRWDVITLVRDPVARNVSSFFQNLLLFFGYDWAEELRLKAEGTVVAELCELFRASFLQEDWVNSGKDSDPLTWFDEELLRTFGVDVFEDEFPKEVGFTILDRPRVRVLLARLEDLDRCVAPAMEQFLGLTGFALHRRNVGLEKGYSSLYRRFVESVEFPKEYLDRLYDSKVSRHFYTEKELAAFRARWRNKSPGSVV